MGCDIHLHAEFKVKGKWLHYNHPDVHRCYALFSKMADVRNQEGKDRIDPIASPKGFPEDATETTKFDYERWGSDAHTPSWLDADEITFLSKWIDKTLRQEWKHGGSEFFGYLFGNDYGSFTSCRDDYPKGIEDIRFVFWFDC